MNISLLILDGLLLVIFLVGWIEATAFSSYKWSCWRFLRALSLPLAIGVTLHFIVNAAWWEKPDPSFLKWAENYTYLITSLAGILGLAFFIFAPILVINLAGFVVAQFTGSSKVFTLPLGDGNIVFAIPAPADEDKNDAQPATKAEYEQWIHKQ